MILSCLFDYGFIKMEASKNNSETANVIECTNKD